MCRSILVLALAAALVPVAQGADPIPAEKVDAAGIAQFRRMVEQGQVGEAAVPADHPDALRLRAQLARITALDLAAIDARAATLAWEVALLPSRTVQLAALPGGKLFATTTWLAQVKPSDDELAAALATQVATLLLDQPRRLLELRAKGLGAGTDPQLHAERRRLVHEADALAVRLLVRAGIAPQTLLDVVARSATTLGIDGGAPWGTQATKGQRLKAIEEAVAAAK